MEVPCPVTGRSAIFASRVLPRPIRAKETAADFRAAMEQLGSVEDPGGVVIDLRGNGGGSLKAAVDICDLLVAKMTVATYWRPSGRDQFLRPRKRQNAASGVSPNEGLDVPVEDDERNRSLGWRQERELAAVSGGKCPAGRTPRSRLAEGRRVPGIEDQGLRFPIGPCGLVHRRFSWIKTEPAAGRRRNRMVYRLAVGVSSSSV